MTLRANVQPIVPMWLCWRAGSDVLGLASGRPGASCPSWRYTSSLPRRRVHLDIARPLDKRANGLAKKLAVHSVVRADSKTDDYVRAAPPDGVNRSKTQVCRFS